MRLPVLFASALLAAPLLAQVNPDACRQVRQDDVVTLVSLNQSTLEENDSPLEHKCDWDVKTPLSFEGGEVRLSIQQFDSHEAAVESLRQEAPLTFDKQPMLVKTAGPDDHIRDSVDGGMAYADAEAVHGEYLAKVEVHRFESGARAHPTFQYRLQRLALQAAGATILPTVGLPPDPVPPKPQPDTPVKHARRTPGWLPLFVLGDTLIFAVVLRLVLRSRRGQRPGEF